MCREGNIATHGRYAESEILLMVVVLSVLLDIIGKNVVVVVVFCSKWD